jgi:hypothetical protein
LISTKIAHNEGVTLPQYSRPEGSAVYVWARPAPSEPGVLTVAQVLAAARPSTFYGFGDQSSDSFDELETSTIEDNSDFHRTLVIRLAGHAALIDAADVV